MHVQTLVCIFVDVSMMQGAPVAVILHYKVLKQFVVPDRAFQEGVASVVVRGVWTVNGWMMTAVYITHPLPDPFESIGRIRTVPCDSLPDFAVETAESWVRTSCAGLGLTVTDVDNENASLLNDDLTVRASVLFVIKGRVAGSQAA